MEGIFRTDTENSFPLAKSRLSNNGRTRFQLHTEIEVTTQQTILWAAIQVSAIVETTTLV